jgi:hypothetical protein
MKYFFFERIMSTQRINRYKLACANNTRKAMTLYRYNLYLSQELFTIISCFEIALRNAINNHYFSLLGNDWLQNVALPGGIFDNFACHKTANIINTAVSRLGVNYNHSKLISEMDFGFWRYLFAQPQYNAAGRTLLNIFPAKPRSTPIFQYNQRFLFNELEKINNLRNRLAHHEPVCFQLGHPIKSTIYARQHYELILQLFQWMQIDESALLYGLDHINVICNDIDAI